MCAALKEAEEVHILCAVCTYILTLYCTILHYTTQDPANGREALLEAALDESEGADFLMVKPGTL